VIIIEIGIRRKRFMSSKFCLDITFIRFWQTRFSSNCRNSNGN